MKRLVMLVLVLWPSGQAFAEFFPASAVRDSIGPDSTLTDGMPGGSAFHGAGGLDFSTPGLVVDAPNTGLLSGARFVIFARDSLLNPENELADIFTYSMEFHVWTEGIEVGVDSYDQNPRGDAIGSHIKVDANTPLVSLIDVQPWGQTGPPESLFTTFLVTVDLSSAGVELQGGQQYVMSLLDRGNNFGTTVGGAPTVGGFFRISGSLATSTTEDLFREDTSSSFPGYIDSQLAFGFEQYAGSLTMGNGNYDGDNDVDGADFLKWQRNFGQSVSDAEDSNGDGIADSADLAFWEAQFGTTWPAPLAASATVPEPTSAALLLTAIACGLVHRRHG